MSGHSHARTVKRVKDAHDAQRGKIFSKIARMISVAAKEGANPEMNSKLRRALEEARTANMPKDNIERAIKRGVGELGKENLEEVNYEAFGPGGIALIIEAITDNKNRALAEIKRILQKYSGKLAESGSVKWLFERKGVITINPNDQIPYKTEPSGYRPMPKKEDLELKAIEAGAEDIFWHKDENMLDLYTKTEDLEKVKESLNNQGIKIELTSLDLVAKDPIEVTQKDKETLEKLFEELSENDAVQDIYSNLKT
ncbi:YebC/PmpR family DNA-binding transcriptional regulator [bacterium (Candidatus Gribaldobacteria) CG_4_9_14_3_um_filter_36_15]|uniref:Probable transcriptional regulatory protein COX73_02040 n=3 Tax=Candidatus Gribaldobacteria TaxID=2798536 RepID=A0A2M7VK24_9BACT|nr:MAG: transcriptional regulator [Parcubacteria group bacterium CG2_30_36_21]PIV14232.1 MAG: YebC/PmpR family DNA-binding transcriptional regulator [bacterium (Candidatus Gribaldobacteria) CG03_land_8_20_14_0_80_36_40]PJA02190.1 MAG: YebC/PmpR family DNA-binding transcriptional regulator [bacterium (Candidatus Gribaldobacteria) CG_4_10_14_0_2_um_filter_36_18]PJB09322.1 MAG: YebC/PmpR family DNA-binding transcriptional regulator [bacterium (Candidatus Gribaldobacteria) CG_4_9_14_3_um_filter_36_1